ncbi:inositol 1,4,5-trisphosphate receptor type 2-like [Dreissena polymorpha]|uniref:inositol 1,4,5-trisphosphate receptor type 2-like n=1 Tax=Dreissena polymorpha TaxID=45954 RepID=UPI002263F6EC|nr:inositol 1,4,5-trisphosphate receptor type 2-like [Dreissena polymorpha]
MSKDLSEYKYGHMISKSMHLLNRYFSAHHSLFGSALHTRVLINKDSVKLHRFLEGKLPELHRLSTSKLGEMEITQLTSILDELIKNSHLKGDKEEPHGINQNIMFSNGVIDECLQIVEQPCEANLEQEQNKSLRKAFKKTFTVLQQLARGHRGIQEYLFDRLDRLLSIAKLPQEMGQTLIEVFIGNARNCKAIEPRHIEKIIKLFMTNKSSANLDLLSVIVKPEVSDVPLKRNQDAFMTYFRKFRAEFASIIELDDSARDAVLTSDNVTSVTSLISLVDLLAICAQGGNSFTTSVCKPIFTILQLLKILNNNSIVDYRKRPFLRFLVWVYVYKPSGQVESGTRTVLDDSTIWSYMENIRGTLKTITDYVKSNPDSVPQLLRRISLSQRDISEDIKGSVRYLFDAVIPFIQIYCQCRLPSGKLSDSTQTTTITNLAKDFQEFIKMMSTHCSSQHQIHDLVTCTRVLISRSDFSTDDVKLFEGKYGQGKVVVSATSDALQSYEGEFKDEEAINRQLKAFARNVKSAYEWETSLSSQNEFSSESTYGKTVRDAELPKGPGFQAHMHCFIDEAAHSLHGQYNMSEKLVKQLIHSTKRSNLSAKDQRDQTEVDIKCLQLLRGIILKEIDELPVDFEKCPRLHKHQLTVIKEIQSVLNKFGLICEVVRLVSSANDLVFREALALLETMLFNGNEEVQTSLIEYFSERKDDTFFLVFQRRISMSSGAIKYSFAQRCLAQNLERTMTVPVEIPESDGISSTFSNNVSRNNKVAPTFIPTQENQRKEESKLSFTTDTIPQDIMDDGCFAMVLNVLRLMCSNQNSRLQDLLREQPESSTSINLVAETSGVVGFLYENISTDSIHLLTRVFETLADLSSCNRGNLKVVFESHVCANANHILQVGMYGECTHREIFLLKQSIGMLLRCLTEENRHGIKEHENESVEVMQCLDVGDLIKTMTEAWKAFNTPADESLVPLVQSVGFLFYHLIARKMERHNDSTVLEDIKDEEVKKALEYYESHSMSIEIVKNDVVQKIYFRVKDKSVLRKEVKDKFKNEIDRSSQTSKIQGLVEWSNDIANDIINRRRISINPFGRLLIKLWTPLNYLVMLFTLAIAVVIMVTWKGDANQPRINAGYRWQGGEIAIYALGGVHNFLSLAILLSYIVSNRPRLPYTGKVFRLFRNDETLEDRQYRSRLEVKIYDWKTIYYVIFLGCSVAGTVTDGYLFAVHFLHIVEMNAHLKRILKSITTNAKSLLLVALLGLAIFYIYALILYAFYRDWKWSADNGRHCTTIYECFVSILHHGLVESPYAQFEGNMTDNFKEAIGVMFFDVSFFIIITLLGFYIILGIIVDTFIQLRNSRGRIEDDLKTVCFICGRKCTDFGLHEKDFTKHIKIEHNLWAYILFFIHLDETNRQEYSPLERYVFMKLIKNELDFFPIHRAPSLEMADAGKTVERHNDPIDHVIPTVKRLEKQMEFLVTRMKDKEEELSNKKSKKRPKTETKP